jgi:putative glutamine amidotransferase
LRALCVEEIARHSVPAVYAGLDHDVSLSPGGLRADVYGVRRGRVSSAHRQAIARLGDGLAVEAIAEADGCIEAIRAHASRFVVGVQWHPEFDGDGRLAGRRLLDHFVACAALHSNVDDPAKDAHGTPR